MRLAQTQQRECDLTLPPCSVPVSNGRLLNSVVKGYSSEILKENKCINATNIVFILLNLENRAFSELPCKTKV